MPIELTTVFPLPWEPVIEPQVDEIELLREKLKTLEQELALTKQQLSKYYNQHKVEFSVRRHAALARYRLEYEMNHPNVGNVNVSDEDEIDSI